ncbi:hypothetical protein SISNIDRAFT_453692 [Sistotremastrum niveocremeum HHB9708]|uniref:Uncharacterized protein n=1 Tax=Sistotremastrum niveocremeum HHB9708 TaxID=1314777 RepID=A0A164VB33_9AGAM|nr:hypothetical protein SISNIDRAFT_453692 [Sistotremastrum niveocremeum HHB9708]
MTLISQYKALSTDSSSSDVQKVFNLISNTPSLQIKSEREALVTAILEDLISKESRLSSRDRPAAISTLKVLGRSDDAARLLSTKESLEYFITILDSSPDAARIVANALLLLGTARQTWVEIGGADATLPLLNSNDTTTLFIASRILFLSTSFKSPLLSHLVEETKLLDTTIPKLDLLTRRLSSDSGASQALSDMLKYIFNLIIHYPPLVNISSTPIEDPWADKLDCLARPLIKCYNNIPITQAQPLVSPLSHVAHCLLYVPVESNASAWFQPSRSPSPPSSITRKAKSFFSSSRSSSPSRSPTLPSSSSSGPPPDVLRRTHEIVSKSLEHYFPGLIEVDALEIRQRIRGDLASPDEIIPPGVMLLRRMAVKDEGARRRLRAWLFPDDLDRTVPLPQHDSLLGRLVRTLSSVHYATLRGAAGEFLFAVCDSDPMTLSSLVGYGNVAGFLFNKGIMSAPGTTPSTDASGMKDSDKINPITGTYYSEGPGPDDEMTEEEKEREAEKLFVLFDRLERSGIAENPIRRAQQEGKLDALAEKMRKQKGKEKEGDESE